MNKRFQLILALCGSILLNVACSTKLATPEKPVPVVQVTSVQAPPAVSPATQTPPTPALEKTVSSVSEEKKDDVKETPSSEVPEPKKDLPPKIEEPATIPPPVPVAKAEPLPPRKTINFRCAYWEKPKNAFDIYVCQNGKMQRCQLFELVFSQVMTPDIGEDGKVTIYRKVDGDFLPIFSVDPCGMKNLSAVILPKFNPDDPKGEYIQLIDIDEKSFPKGSIKVLNWAHQEIDGELTFRGSGKKQHFKLKCGEFFISDALAANRDICNIRFFDEEKPALSIFESAFSFFKENQTVLFVLKNEHGKGFDFKMSKVR